MHNPVHVLIVVVIAAATVPPLLGFNGTMNSSAFSTEFVVRFVKYIVAQIRTCPWLGFREETPHKCGGWGRMGGVTKGGAV
jgi:hypothetical protein